MRLSRKEKKIIRAIMLCHTGNYDFKHRKISKSEWLGEKDFYNVWFKCFDMRDRKAANTIKSKP